MVSDLLFIWGYSVYDVKKKNKWNNVSLKAVKCEGKSSEEIKYGLTATKKIRKHKCSLKSPESKVLHILRGNKSFYSIWLISGDSVNHV